VLAPVALGWRFWDERARTIKQVRRRVRRARRLQRRAVSRAVGLVLSARAGAAPPAGPGEGAPPSGNGNGADPVAAGAARPEAPVEGRA